ncbi:hypothetical protein CVT26_003132 [Gymnopilus dilepis]|uniref:Uncharacterized protein n=1 Tax=Gymnopilus dilepis TaxID=231916 RepID=A0A409Y4S0_9AGAR|nr:hypothetical protein CVT26_003132 [Gymnopilus dilepis]
MRYVLKVERLRAATFEYHPHLVDLLVSIQKKPGGVIDAHLTWLLGLETIVQNIYELVVYEVSQVHTHRARNVENGEVENPAHEVNSLVTV